MVTTKSPQFSFCFFFCCRWLIFRNFVFFASAFSNSFVAMPYAGQKRGFNQVVLRKSARSMPVSLAIKQGRVKSRRRLYRGYQRNVGYYGRFTGPSPELKFFDTALSFQVDNTAEIPATGQLALIPQDDTQSGRDGNKAFIKSIDIHGIMAYDPAASASSVTGTVVFMYLMQDTQCNGTAATVADANSGIFTTNNLATANHTLANKDRFRVLKKWVIPFNPGAGVSTAYVGMMKPFSIHKKCSIPIMYDASVTTGALTSIRSNNIFLVAGTGGLGDDQVTVNGTCRLRFSDTA
nr:MAG: putative capsid protein [Arizlama virus]